jgi:hypothetical protein
MIRGVGYNRLWGWFGLSRSSFITLPRVLVHEMPDDWQSRMADLLSEYDAAYPNMPSIGTTVRATDLSGKLIKMPDWAINYRHPDHAAIDLLRSGADN